MTWQRRTTNCQQAFDNLKAAFVEVPVLLMPDTAKPFVVESDTSKWATGGVLWQQDDNGDWHSYGFISHSFDQTKRNYKIYDHELLGIVHALETWCHYLQGSQFPTVILSDHKNLTYFQTAQKLNRRQARWSLFLSKFDLKLIHVLGSRMIQSDSLSCCTDHILNDTNNDDVIVLPDNIFICLLNLDLQDEIWQKTIDDEFFSKAVTLLQDHGPTPICSALDDWSNDNGLLFYQGRCYIPDDKGLQLKVIQQHHDLTTAGHLGHLKTLKLIKRSYWWPGISVFVKNFVAGCAVCQQMKVNTHLSSPGLIPIRTDPGALPFSQVTCDFIMDLLLSAGFDSLMVMVDHSPTKGVICIPCHKTIDAQTTAQNFIDHVFWRFC